MNEERLSDQIGRLIDENRRLRVKSNEDDETIRMLTDKLEELQAGVNGMIETHREAEDSMKEEHRAIQRDLSFRADNAEIKERKMRSLVNQAADLILQAMRAEAGDETPKKMPQRQLENLNDDRLPPTGYLS